jgi:hypothetical protein
MIINKINQRQAPIDKNIVKTILCVLGKWFLPIPMIVLKINIRAERERAIKIMKMEIVCGGI